MQYEIIVVGGGHAGCEAALASAKRHKTLLVTGRIENIATMPCNPSIGGSAKGIVVREPSVISVDAKTGNVIATGFEQEQNITSLGVENIVNRAWDKKINQTPASSETPSSTNELDIPAFLRKNRGTTRK